MGRLPFGPNGPLIGKLGKMSGASWKGTYYVRSLPESTVRKPSEGQAVQRARLSTASRFLKPMKELLAISFQYPGMTGYNRALSYVLKNAVYGSYPDYRIHYPSVIISQGDLPNALEPSATAGGNGQLIFTWTDNSDMGKAGPRDTILMLVYCDTIRQCNFRMVDITRSSGKAVYDLAPYKGLTVQTWLGFISEDRKDISPGVFTGEVLIS